MSDTHIVALPGWLFGTPPTSGRILWVQRGVQWSDGPSAWVERAEAWTKAETPLQPSPAVLARRLGVSRADLDDAFVWRRGLPAAESLRNLRLQIVRDIVEGRPGLPLRDATRLAGYWRRRAFRRDFALRAGWLSPGWRAPPAPRR